MKKLFVIFSVSVLAMFILQIFTPSFVNAQASTQMPGVFSNPTTPYVNAPTPSGCSGSGCYQAISPITLPGGGAVPVNSLPNYLQAIYKIGIGLCFVLGVIMFTWAGIEYIVSESMSGKGDAKKRITAALTGLAIALVSYILLNTINPDLLKLKDLNIQPAAATK